MVQGDLATCITEGIELPAAVQGAERPLDQLHLDHLVDLVIVAGGKRFCQAAHGKTDTGTHLVMLMRKHPGLRAPGQKLRVRLDVADQGKHFLRRVRHQRRAVYFFHVNFPAAAGCIRRSR